MGVMGAMSIMGIMGIMGVMGVMGNKSPSPWERAGERPFISLGEG